MTDLQTVDMEQRRLLAEIAMHEKSLYELTVLRKANEAVWLDLKCSEALSRIEDPNEVKNVRYYGRWDSEFKSRSNPNPRKYLTKVVRVVWFKSGDALHSLINLNVDGEVLGLTQNSYVQNCMVNTPAHGYGLGHWIANMIEMAAPLRTEKVTVDREPYFPELPVETQTK